MLYFGAKIVLLIEKKKKRHLFYCGNPLFFQVTAVISIFSITFLFCYYIFPISP